MLHAFVMGHVLFSFAAPLALAEAWIPSRAHRPWLGRIGTVLALLACLLVGVMILSDPGSRTATAAQLIGTAAVVVGLLVLAVMLGRRRMRKGAAADGVAADGASHIETPAGRPPRPWHVLLGALLMSLVIEVSPPIWIGLAAAVGAVIALGLALMCASRRPGWTVHNVAAAGLGLLLGRGLLAFTTTPLAGEVDQAAKLGHNVVMIGIVLVAGVVALRKSESAWKRSNRATG